MKLLCTPSSAELSLNGISEMEEKRALRYSQATYWDWQKAEFPLRFYFPCLCFVNGRRFCFSLSSSSSQSSWAVPGETSFLSVLFLPFAIFKGGFPELQPFRGELNRSPGAVTAGLCVPSAGTRAFRTLYAAPAATKTWTWPYTSPMSAEEHLWAVPGGFSVSVAQWSPYFSTD